MVADSENAPDPVWLLQTLIAPRLDGGGATRAEVRTRIERVGLAARHSLEERARPRLGHSGSIDSGRHGALGIRAAFHAPRCRRGEQGE